MKNLKPAAITATLVALLVGCVAATRAPAQIENCKPVPRTNHSACVWTIDETTRFVVGARYMANGKPAASVPVTIRQTTTGAAGYTCETATAENAACEFGVSGARTISLQAFVGGAEFVWHNGSWQ